MSIYVLRVDANCCKLPYFRGGKNVLAALFSCTLDLDQRALNSAELVEAYSDSNALEILGRALVEHLGMLHSQEESRPLPDSLEAWSKTRDKAEQDIVGLEIPLRILRTGIDFLKSGGEKREILLDLNSEERQILEQALDLPKE